MKTFKIHPSIIIMAAILAIAVFSGIKARAGRARISEFGKYQGYSPAMYNGSKRTSDYMTLPDGTRLAYDLILPAKKDVPAGEPLPVLFKYTPYLRTMTIFDRDGKNLIADFMDFGWPEKAYLRLRYRLSKQGRCMDPLFRTRWLERMVRHGYAVIVVERPGTGASFGVMNPGMAAVAAEENEILDWIASQAWCNGKIGMFGESQQAWFQFAAAATGNPHLKAIFPAASQLDLYDMEYRGGVYNKAFNSFYARVVPYLDHLITPVDRDQDGALLDQALRERGGSMDAKSMIAGAAQYPFRDSIAANGKRLWQDVMPLYPFLERVNSSGIPVYMTTGWYDIFPADIFYWYDNLTVPKRLTARPLDHSGMDAAGPDLDYAAEAHRWFDYWLKGIENGIMAEPPIHYYTMGTPKKDAWRTSDRWPPAGREGTPFYFGPGRTGSVSSANDGFLNPKPPAAPAASDAYTVDYSTTSGAISRWVAVDEASDYPDMRANDAKALTYTTAPLEKEVEVTGHPVAHLWLKTFAPDLDVFVYLEEVDSKGRSSYITEGVLRASHRALGQAPFRNLGLPFHTHYRSDLAPFPPGEPVELVFSLLPTSHRFRRGNRIRITVTCADADNFETPVLKPAPSLRMLREAEHPSFVLLPVGQAR